MISFDRGDITFRLSARGIAIHEDRVLLQQIAGRDYWFLPGGAAELFETCAETLKREAQEELHEEATIGRLVWVVENYFRMNDRLCHEHALFFLMTFPPDAAIVKKPELRSVEDDGSPVVNRWHRIDGLSGLDVRPAFLREGLARIPERTEYMVQRDIPG